MNRNPTQPLQVLLRVCLDLAVERADVREALIELRDWLNESSIAWGAVDATRAMEVREVAAQPEGVFEKVLSPGPERRVVSMRAGNEGAEGAAGSERRLRERKPPDLQLIQRRAQWKADAVRWAVERRRLESEGADYATLLRPKDEELRARREQLEDCYAWMLDPYRRLPEDERMLFIAASYENIALAAECTQQLIAAGALEPAPPAELLYLLAEVQSALLAALDAVDLRGDSDQRDLFLWLKNQTLRHRIYVDRHMKLDDPADFRSSPERAQRLRGLVDSLTERKQAMRRRAQLLNKVRFHVRKLGAGEGLLEDELASIAQAIQEWTDSGHPLSDRHLLELLRGLPEEVVAQDGLPSGIGQALAAEGPTAAPAANAADPERERAHRRESVLLKGRELVQGMRALVLGTGDAGEACLELERDLGLLQVRWLALEEELVLETLERAIAAPETDLVLLSLRLPENAYADFKRLCREHNAPFVRLPSGLEAPEVAQQILRQVGRMLQGRMATGA